MKKILIRTAVFAVLLALCCGLAYAEADDTDFVIEDGVLKYYIGLGGNVVIQESVTVIGNNVFKNCTRLTSVTNPSNSITDIRHEAFYGCSSLKSVSFPRVTTLGDYVFANCTSLQTAYVPNAGGPKMFNGCTNLREATIGGDIDCYSFSNCTSLTTVTVTKGTIGEYAFWPDCTSLTSVTLGNGVTEIAGKAFSNCDDLRSLMILNSEISIDGSAFDGSSFSGSDDITINCLYFAGTEEQWKRIFPGSVRARKFFPGPDTVTSVNLNSDGHGRISADKYSGKPGESVTLTVTPDSGYALDTLKYTYVMADGENTITVDLNQTVRVFYIPLCFVGNLDVLVTATFYLADIGNEADWRELAEKVSAGGSTEGKRFRLTDDITVSTMIGTNDHPFKGTFDGDGHTLTVDISTSSTDIHTAPFSWVEDVTIKNLRVVGTIKETYSRASGLIGENKGTSTVTNCRVSATISGNTLIGGFCIGAGDALSLTGCVFDGKITANEKCGGFAGWSTAGLRITDSLFVPKADSSFQGGTFYHVGDGTDSGPATLTNCYYLTPIGTAQGTLARTVTAKTAVPLDFTEGKMYDVSGIRSHSPGLSCGGVLYTPGNTTVDLTIASLPEGITFENLTASAGTLTKNGSGWTLDMPDENVILTASFSGAFGEADFRLPVNVTAIGANAFEGAKMTAVEIPDGCASIGAGAFRDCAELGKIRIPASVKEIHPTAFDGCPLVLVFAREPSKAYEYCNDGEHPNCMFVEEK